MASVTIGPVALPGELLLLGATLVLALVMAKLWRRRWQVEVEPKVWRALWLGLLAARLSFVLEFATVYSDAPWQIFNLRDGGWNGWAGWVAVAGYVGWLALGQARRSPARHALMVTLVMAAAVWWGGAAALSHWDTQGARLPALSLGQLEVGEGEKSLTEFAGRPVVLNLWATWCPPCLREMPALQRAQQQYPGVHFVFANQGESREKVQRFLALKGLMLDNVLLDEQGALARHFQQRGLPTTFFFGADGTLLEARTGELSDASIAQRLARWPGAAVKP